jgi:hypothetical protein
MTDDKPVPLGKKCRPDDLDNAPPGENQPNYPTANPQYGYNYQNPTHKILVMFQDGHHGPDRWNLSENEVGTPENPSHEHDDWKRSPPTILDQDPEQGQVGFYAKKRLPDSADQYSVPGDQLPRQ